MRAQLCVCVRARVRDLRQRGTSLDERGVKGRRCESGPQFSLRTSRGEARTHKRPDTLTKTFHVPSTPASRPGGRAGSVPAGERGAMREREREQAMPAGAQANSHTCRGGTRARPRRALADAANARCTCSLAWGVRRGVQRHQLRWRAALKRGEVASSALSATSCGPLLGRSRPRAQRSAGCLHPPSLTPTACVCG